MGKLGYSSQMAGISWRMVRIQDLATGNSQGNGEAQRNFVKDSTKETTRLRQATFLLKVVKAAVIPIQITCETS